MECSMYWELHEHKINSIDFNSQNPHVMAGYKFHRWNCLPLRLEKHGSKKKTKTLTTITQVYGFYDECIRNYGENLRAASKGRICSSIGFRNRL
ncbi:unnamed protein product [Arabidopsis thaliana]|uniref:(thale cress) hypothetical protein n=1 Tax=Arabidopsis thaliana TaxID=3702 RepID=A0A7G2E1T6_ARATH|nr:unnamed protein product [Arabidopsis thaliana]